MTNSAEISDHSSITLHFARYVSQNVLGMLGVSCYIIADTFFISRAAGADGITVLNLALPIYSLIFAMGSMIGIGSATRFAILRAQGRREADDYLGNAILWAFLLGLPLVLCGIFCPGLMLRLMGGDAQITALGVGYARYMLLFTPFFMLNYIFSAFVRNDGDPTRAMISTVSGSLFNIVFDYVLMFPVGMGLPGAALASALAPIVSTLLNCTHFLSSENTLRFHFRLSFRNLLDSCRLGISAFIGEFSSAVTTTVFNFLILSLVGNIGVAAYGVVANFALVAMAIFNGISQGAQPLLSEAYGSGKKKDLAMLLRLGLFTSAAAALLIYALVWGLTAPLVSLFNSEGDLTLAGYAFEGMRIYFLGFFFAGINVYASGYFSAVNRPSEAGAASISRGIAAIIVCALLLAKLFGFTGVWASFPAAEGITFLMILFFLSRKKEASHQASFDI